MKQIDELQEKIDEEVLLKAFLYDLNKVCDKYGINWVEPRDQKLSVSRNSGATVYDLNHQHTWDFQESRGGA